MEQELYTTTQAAKLFGVTPRTIQMWADNGLIAVTKTLGGHRRIHADEIQRLASRLGRPVSINAASVATQSADSAAKQQGNAIRLMFVDDDRDLLNLYHMQIKRWQTPSMEVHLASDGYEALLKIGAIKPDIIMLDLTLPSIDAHQMIKGIQQQPELKHAQIVAITELHRDETDKHFSLPDNVLVEEKPVSFARIQRLVTDYGNRQPAISE